ncbi:MAG TPA: L-serine ammonia-lyase, iron-sulfur-dependent, subunit alpha [Acidobacteriota bacterium]|nr:L-serine ammonia-lyase, iron-sulfur-dependent, subunit alpha [Acidobacteriota bacterium]
MRANSIFNHILGPVMRGPSSSHTAASYRIAKTVCELFGEEIKLASFKFDTGGSYGQVYDRQGSDLAIACGLLGLKLEDERFFKALELAKERGLEIDFSVGKVEGDDHPNAVEIEVTAKGGRCLKFLARSIGGGLFVITRIDNLPVHITGEGYDLLVLMDQGSLPEVDRLLERDGWAIRDLRKSPDQDQVMLLAGSTRAVEDTFIEDLRGIPGVMKATCASLVFFPQAGEPLFRCAEEMVALAEKRGNSLGELAVEYESVLLDMRPEEVMAEMGRRLDIMSSAVERGLSDGDLPMQLLEPSAHRIFAAEREGRVALGGILTRAAARAMAAMHVNSAMGVVCAAPTGGSAGAIPGVIVTLMEERRLSREDAIRALFAAGAIGLIILNRGTFAAEEAGCQVEIGAAGAMAAAAVVEAVGGSVVQAADAAAISLQNTLGMPCDLVQGAVEIPCHTRNAVAASSAFINADLIMGGYRNPISLDETIDASISAGRSLPSELRCTARGGLATAPSARSLTRRK